jgi:hypothetical protein
MTPLVKQLLCNPHINIEFSQNGKTALDFAKENNRLDVAEMLTMYKGLNDIKADTYSSRSTIAEQLKEEWKSENDIKKLTDKVRLFTSMDFLAQKLESIPEDYDLDYDIRSKIDTIKSQVEACYKKAEEAKSENLYEVFSELKEYAKTFADSFPLSLPPTPSSPRLFKSVPNNTTFNKVHEILLECGLTKKEPGVSPQNSMQNRS